MNVSSYFLRRSRQGTALAVPVLFLLLANAPAAAAGLILWDSFNDETAFARDDGYNFFSVAPDVGTEGVLRYWEPGYWGSGATTASYINFSPAGRFGNGVTFNYSGNSNGWCSQDAINYPIGGQMSPAEGTIEFWYKPHFDHTDTSAVIQVLSGYKSNLDYPLQTYYERQRHSQSYLWFAYHGWSGRHYWTFSVNERDASGNVTHDTFARTPPESDPNRFTFNAEQWMHVGLVWKSNGVEDYGNKTVMLFIDGVEVASTTQTYPTTYPFGEYLVLGSSTGQSFDPSLPGNNYSGASGDIDNLKIWDYAKTDFSDRFKEDPRHESAALAVVAANIHFARNDGSEDLEAKETYGYTGGPYCPNKGGDRLRVIGTIDLAEDSDGIDPPGQDVTFSAGIHSVDIPAGSFRWWPKAEAYGYVGKYDGGWMTLMLKELSFAEGLWEYRARFVGVNNSGMSSPMAVKLSVGDDSGETEVNLFGTLRYEEP